MGNKISKNNKIIIGGCIGVAAIATFLTLKQKSNETPNPQNQQKAQVTLQSQPQQQQQQQQPQQQNFSQSASADQLAQTIQVTKAQGDALSLNTIMQILEKSLELVSDEYKVMTLQNREQRRPLRQSDVNQYIDKVLKYQLAIEEVMQQKQELLCEKLQISGTQMEESIMQLMQSGHFEQFFMLQASIRQKIKEKIPSSKDIEYNTLKDIINYQLKLIKEKPQDITNLIQNLMQIENQEQQQLAPLVINTLIGDLVFERFQVEEEDIIKMITNPNVLQQPEIQQMMMQLEQGMFELMQGFNPQGF